MAGNYDILAYLLGTGLQAGQQKQAQRRQFQQQDNEWQMKQAQDARDAEEARQRQILQGLNIQQAQKTVNQPWSNPNTVDWLSKLSPRSQSQVPASLLGAPDQARQGFVTDYNKPVTNRVLSPQELQGLGWPAEAAQEPLPLPAYNRRPLETASEETARLNRDTRASTAEQSALNKAWSQITEAWKASGTEAALAVAVPLEAQYPGILARAKALPDTIGSQRLALDKIKYADTVRRQAWQDAVQFRSKESVAAYRKADLQLKAAMQGVTLPDDFLPPINLPDPEKYKGEPNAWLSASDQNGQDVPPAPLGNVTGPGGVQTSIRRESGSGLPSLPQGGWMGMPQGKPTTNPYADVASGVSRRKATAETYAANRESRAADAAARAANPKKKSLFESLPAATKAKVLASFTPEEFDANPGAAMKKINAKERDVSGDYISATRKWELGVIGWPPLYLKDQPSVADTRSQQYVARGWVEFDEKGNPVVKNREKVTADIAEYTKKLRAGKSKPAASKPTGGGDKPTVTGVLQHARQTGKTAAQVKAALMNAFGHDFPQARKQYGF
jgi:hypothetical protein